jgi:hypothetical protein
MFYLAASWSERSTTPPPAVEVCLSEAEFVERHILGVPTQSNPEHTYVQLEQRIV